MKAQKYASFAEFWPDYIRLHTKHATRLIHVAGTGAGVIFVLMAIYFLEPTLLVMAILVSYGPAWLSHFFIEHNRPASWQNPWWSFRADFKMCLLFWSGKLDAEVKRSL